MRFTVLLGSHRVSAALAPTTALGKEPSSGLELASVGVVRSLSRATKPLRHRAGWLCYFVASHLFVKPTHPRLHLFLQCPRTALLCCSHERIRALPCCLSDGLLPKGVSNVDGVCYSKMCAFIERCFVRDMLFLKMVFTTLRNFR